MSDTKPTIASAVLENAARAEGQRLSAEQLAAVLGVEVASIHQCMSRLRRAGRLKASDRQVTRAALPMPNGERRPALPNGGNPEALFDALQRGDVLSADERLRLASHLARTAPGPVAVGALKLLAVDLDPVTPAQVGPPPPMTRGEQVQRLARLIVACGLDVARDALAEAERMIESESGVGALAPAPDPARD